MPISMQFIIENKNAGTLHCRKCTYCIYECLKLRRKRKN